MKNTLTRYSVFILLLGLIINTAGIAQEQDITNYRMRFNFRTIKQHDNVRILETSFIAANKKDRKDIVPVYEAEIKFFNVLNEEEVLLGKSKTSKEGIAKITLPENQQYLMDVEGNIVFKAIFEGTDELDSDEEEIIIKNLNLELSLTEKDSLKIVMVESYTLDSLGIKIPLDEADIIISVDGMLSKMNIGEGTIENGEFEFEFPEDLPGDSNGDLTVYAILEDHEIYGDVIQKKTVNWGIFNKQIKEDKYTLWSEAAPIWMYVVLTILLVGVWANYIYTIVNLLKIKREGKKLEFKTENS